MEAAPKRWASAAPAAAAAGRVPTVGIAEVAGVTAGAWVAAAPGAATVGCAEAGVATEDTGRGEAPLAAAPHPQPARRTAAAEVGEAAAAAWAWAPAADPVEAVGGRVDYSGRTLDTARHRRVAKIVAPVPCVSPNIAPRVEPLPGGAAPAVTEAAPGMAATVRAASSS